MWRFAKAMAWMLTGGAVIAATTYILAPEHRRMAGQTYEVQNHLWVSTSVKWSGDPEARTLEIQLVSLWGEGEVYYTHDRLKELCDAVLGKPPNDSNGLVFRDDVRVVSMDVFRGWRDMTETPVRMQVEDGKCLRKQEPAPVDDDEDRIRRPSAAEAAANAAFLKDWKNVRTNFIKGSWGDGRYFEFVPKYAGRSIESFDFRQACRLALSRMPETQQTKFGLLDYLQRGAITVRVQEYETEIGETRPKYETREFAVENRDCVLAAEADR